MPFVVINKNPEVKLWYEVLGDTAAGSNAIRIVFVMGLK